MYGSATVRHAPVLTGMASGCNSILYLPLFIVVHSPVNRSPNSLMSSSRTGPCLVTIGGKSDVSSFDNPGFAVTVVGAVGPETWYVAEEAGNVSEHIGSIFFILGAENGMLSCAELGVACVAATNREV